jgi:DNA-binding HxlR family transcriptional regulator
VLTSMIGEILDLTRPRWSMAVLTTLAEQPRRYTDLQHCIAASSSRAVHARSLTATLRRLQENGLVAHQPASPGAKLSIP